MKSLVLMVLFVTVVSCQRDLIKKIEDLQWNRNGLNVIDISSPTVKKVSDVDLSPLVVIGHWTDHLKLKCVNTKEHDQYNIFEVAKTSYDDCREEVSDRLRDDEPDYSAPILQEINFICRSLSEEKSCFSKFIEALQPCLPSYMGGAFPFNKIWQAFMSFTCDGYGAQDRMKSYFESKDTCPFEVFLGLVNCSKGYSPQLEDASYMFTEESCRKTSALHKCIKAEFDKCFETPMIYLEGFSQALAQVYTPCPKQTKSSNLNNILKYGNL